jgi:hypothetical protein
MNSSEVTNQVPKLEYGGKVMNSYESRHMNCTDSTNSSVTSSLFSLTSERAADLLASSIVFS